MGTDREQAARPGMAQWYWLVLPLTLMFFALWLGSGSAQPIAYSDFKRLLDAGKVEEVSVAADTITGVLRPEGLEKILPEQTAAAFKRPGGAASHRFSTVRVTDPDLVAELDAAGVRYTGEAGGGLLATTLSWLVPLGLLFAFSAYLSRKMGAASGWAFDVGKSRARVYSESKTGVTFDDVAGIDEAKEELREIVDFLKQPERYRRLGGKIPKGVLIVGAPGTGKTLLAKALAGEAGVPFFSISGSEFVEMFVGVGAARVRDLFKQAQAQAPCIVFIDELDALGKARSIGVLAGTHSEQEQTLNQLLVEMDGFSPNSGVIILAATNRPEVLDQALLRPGRFDRHVALDRPDLKGREQILRIHVRAVALAPDVELGTIAARSAGFAGADLANLVNEAVLRAARTGKERVEMSDFEEALDRVVAGLEKRSRVMNPQEKETVAYHEAGHAIVAQFRPHADRVAKVSIIPRGIAALGYTQQLPSEDRYLLKRAELLDRLDVLLGGRTAEELAFGDVSTGAQNDLQGATELARHMVTQYAMSEQLGLASFEQARSPLDNPLSPTQHLPYSEHTAQIVDAEVEKLLADAHARVRATLVAQRSLLDALAHQLLEHETVDRAALDALVRAHPGAAAA